MGTGFSNHVKGEKSETSTSICPGKKEEDSLYRLSVLLPLATGLFETQVPEELEFPQELHAGKRKRLKLSGSQRRNLSEDLGAESGVETILGQEEEWGLGRELDQECLPLDLRLQATLSELSSRGGWGWGPLGSLCSSSQCDPTK